MARSTSNSLDHEISINLICNALTDLVFELCKKSSKANHIEQDFLLISRQFQRTLTQKYPPISPSIVLNSSCVRVQTMLLKSGIKGEEEDLFA